MVWLLCNQVIVGKRYILVEQKFKEHALNHKLNDLNALLFDRLR